MTKVRFILSDEGSDLFRSSRDRIEERVLVELDRLRREEFGAIAFMRILLHFYRPIEDPDRQLYLDEVIKLAYLARQNLNVPVRDVLTPITIRREAC